MITIMMPSLPLLYSTLRYATLLYPTLLYATLRYSTLLCIQLGVGHTSMAGSGSIVVWRRIAICTFVPTRTGRLQMPSRFPTVDNTWHGKHNAAESGGCGLCCLQDIGCKEAGAHDAWWCGRSGLSYPACGEVICKQASKLKLTLWLTRASPSNHRSETWCSPAYRHLAHSMKRMQYGGARAIRRH